MGNRNLKDRLDARPIDFDREAIWNNVASSQPSKRRAFFWWLFGFVLLVSISTIWYLAIPKNEIIVTQNVENENLYKGQDPKVVIENNVNVNVDVDESERLDKEETVNNDQVNELEVFEHDLKNDDNNLQFTKKKDNIHYVIEQSGKLNKEIKDLENGDMNPDNKYKVKESKFTSKSLEEQAITGRERLGVISIAPLLTLGGMIVSDHQLLRIYPSITTTDLVRNFNVKKNEINIGIGIGSALHKFGGDDPFLRSSYESNLENLAANIGYKRRFGNHWVVAIDIVANRSTTNLQRSETNTNYQFVAQSESTIKHTYRTDYDLFNEYLSVDLFTGIGYSFDIERWKVIPIVGLGTGLIFKAEGDVLDANGNLITFANLDTYKDRLGLRYFTSLLVHRMITKNLGLGLNLKMSSSYNLMITPDEHTIRPIGLSLFSSYRF